MLMGANQELEAVCDECIHASNVLQFNLFGRRNCECHAATNSFDRRICKCNSQLIHSAGAIMSAAQRFIHSASAIVDAVPRFNMIIPNAIIISHVPHGD